MSGQCDIYKINFTNGDIKEFEVYNGKDGEGNMTTTIYDTNNNGIVDDAEKVNGHTVNSDVPENAVFTDTKYSNATGTSAGLMSAEDKVKLNGIATEANKYVLPTASAILGGVKTTSTVTSSSGYTACPIISGIPYYKDTNTTYSNATTSAAGLMSSGDKSKLDGIVSGANKTTINNTLTSTSTSEALSAAQGKALNNKYNGTILYNNATGTTGTVTLSETSANFNRIKIMYKDVNNVYNETEIHNPNGKKVNLSVLRNGAVAIVFYNAIISISGTSVTWDTNKVYNLSSNNFADTAGILITKIVGHR